jgi:nickel-type superoxide dismutase maturation protease
MVQPPSDEGPWDRTYHRARRTRRPLLAGTGFTVAAAYAFLRWKPFRVEVRGSSMLPSLSPGDWALAVAASRYRRGDVVVVEHPGRPGLEIVKRVVALPGDLAPDGRILGAEEFWIEGDRPESSTDSRSFGPVQHEHLKARVRLVYWPLPRRRRL